MSTFIFDDPKAAFIHIPKTGGLTIRKGIWGGRYDGPYVGEWKEEWDKLFSFAFVRHPIDRFVSAFYMFTEGTNVKSKPRNPNMSVDLFADRAFYSTDYDVTHSIAHHTVPITHPINNIDKADFIGRYERFESDLKAIKVHLGIDDPWIPKFNVSQRYATWKQVVKKEMSPGTYNQLLDYYHDDFVEFDYEIQRLDDL